MRHIKKIPRDFYFMLLILMLLVYKSSNILAAQEVCRPPLVPFGVNREELKDGWLHTTGGVVNDTRMLELDYFDNRLIDQFEFNSQGWVDMTTIHEDDRKQKYRHKVPIKFGEYTISQDSSTDYEVCASDGFVTFYCEKAVVSGETERIEWAYTVEIAPFGDLNGDECINGYDLGLMIGEWGTEGSPADFNNDGTVDPADLGIMLANWKDYDCVEPPEGSICGDGICDSDENNDTCPEDCPNDNGGDDPYDPLWDSADDIMAFTIDSLANPILVENVTVENLKGGLIGIVDDTGNSGTKFFHMFGNWQVLGVSGWSPLDIWVVEVYDDGILVGRTSSNSSGPVYNPDGSSNYGNSIFWKPAIESFKVGDRWILYRWIETPNIPEYPPSRID